MSFGNGFKGDEEVTPTEGIPLGHPGNREVLAFLANDVTELKEHTRIIRTLYEAIRSMTFQIGVQMQAQLIDEYERHLSAGATNLTHLRAVATKR